jgi:TMEM175 potassium channel family protein
MERACQALKKLNVFAKMPAQDAGSAMFSKARLDTLSDGIFAVAMTLLILDVRLPDDFHPRDGGELLQGVYALWPKVLPYVLSFGVLGLRWLASLELRSRADFVNREYVNWWLLYLLLITCVPFTTIVVGRFVRFAPAIWLYAGITLSIALIAMRLTAITPGLEQGEHLRHRQVSAMLLVASSLLAIALSFVNPRVALWALALNFAGPLLRKWHRPRAEVADRGSAVGHN